MKPVLENLYNSALELLTPLDLEKTYQVIVEEAIRLTPHAEDGSIFIEEEGTLKRVYATSKDMFKLKPRKNGYIYSAYKENKAKILSFEQVSKYHPEIKKALFRSNITIPLSHKKKQLGLLTVYSHNALFSDNELSILKLFGPLATLAINKNQALAESDQALKTRDLFISIAAHELRTPLTTLGVYSQILKKHIDKGKPIDARWIEILDDETKWLNVLFNELLAVDQIKKGTFSYQWGENNLDEIIQRALIHMKVQFPKQKVVLTDTIPHQDKFIYSDFDKLLQVFVNLLTNAAKFSQNNEEIKMNLEQNGSKYIITIQDNGRGIDQKELKNIFSGFYKGKDNTKKGMGLGLYITKEIITHHKGNIYIDSEPEEGTTVTLKLPKSFQ